MTGGWDGDVDRFRALFEPRGVLIAGASSHPGKFGFVSLHNLLAAGYDGRVFGTNLEGQDVLGVHTVASVDELPDGQIDLAFVCTPAAANQELLEACAKKGITAAERFRYDYSKEELKEWLPRIETLADAADTVHALMNNCYSDYGIRSARALEDLLF